MLLWNCWKFVSKSHLKKLFIKIMEKWVFPLLLLVHNCTSLKNKRVFSMLIWCIFNLQKEEKKLSSMHVHYVTRSCDHSFCIQYCVTEFDHTWATGMQLVLVQIGPSCPHSYSILILSLSSAGWTDYRCLQSLLTGAVWLSCPNLGVWLGIFSCTYVHTFLQSSLLHIHNKSGNNDHTTTGNKKRAFSHKIYFLQLCL
jgi:hypothetical protein